MLETRGRNSGEKAIDKGIHTDYIVSNSSNFIVILIIVMIVIKK